MDKELERIRAEVFGTIPNKRPSKLLLLAVAAAFFAVGFITAPVATHQPQRVNYSPEQSARLHQVDFNLPEIEVVYRPSI